jgi:A/G-specific adenine glycosylase
VAEGGKELFDLGAFAGGAGDLLVTEDQDLKILIALHAVIFKDRHGYLPIYYQYTLNITPPKTFFQSFRNFLILAFHDIVCNKDTVPTMASDTKKPRTLSFQEIRRFQKLVYDHYRRNGRKLPWRKTRDPYHILLSELMLQQTQVARVIDKYKAFLRRFPTLESLVRAPLRDVLGVWQGLGYNRRALALKRLATIIVSDYGGRIPPHIDVLQALPGVGAATAGAVCAFAFNKPAVFVETNIRSVFIHHFFHDRDGVKDNEILPLVAQTLDAKRTRRWYYALMDYGVALKERHSNPSRRSAHYTIQSPFEGSLRQVRGMILRALVKDPGMTESVLVKELNRDVDQVGKSLQQLCKEGFVFKKGKRFFIADR